MVRGDDPEEQIRLEKISSAVAASNGSKAAADEWLVKIEREDHTPSP